MLLNVLEDVVKFCEARGAEAEVTGIKVREIIVTMERNDVNLCINQWLTGVGIRSVIDNCMGFASCNALDENTTRKTAEKAISMCRKTPPLPFSVFAPFRPLPEVRGLYDPEIESFDEEKAISAVEAMIEAARKDPRVSVDNGEFAVTLREEAISTSAGISAEERKSQFSWFLTGLACENAEAGQLEYQYGCTTRVKELYVEKTAKTLAQRILANLRPQRVDSFSGDLILGPEAVGTIIGDPLIFSVNANSVQKGQSVLSGRIGEKIASEVVTVTDNPCVAGDFNSRKFDREGAPHQDLTLVKKGVLTSFMYDSLTAHRENLSSTGNAVGTFREIPRIGISRFAIEQGTHTLQTILEETEKGLLMSRFAGTADYVSGDFSGTVKGAQFIRSGKIQYPIKEATITGNLYKILPAVCAVSQESYRYPKMILPFVKIPGMKITA